MTPRRDDRPPLTLGTAGHIDHGKTALVNVLTGTNTDRLPEERSRGISIELGYAALDLPSGRSLSVVDVPGHERFVRTMVAGASGVDMFLLCVAADDGVMPQTREHLAVLRRLGVSEGVVAVTKADLGEPELAAEEAAELVPGARVVQVSALTGGGLDELRGALDEVAARLPGRAGDDGPVRLHVDRSFTLRGIGTVVTGTLWSGSVAAGDPVRVLPRGLSARVRSVQVHDRPVERAAAGQRVALNLAGVGWRELGRGDVVTTPDAPLRPGYLLDVRAELEPGARPLRRGARVHVHHGTREAPARVSPLEGERVTPDASGLVQLRLEAPLVAAAGDRLILRQVAPPDTIGGGVVVDAEPRKHGAREEVVERLRAIERGEPVETRVPASRESMQPEPDAEPEPLDDEALHLAALLRSDGTTPRADADLAAAAGLDERAAEERLRLLRGAGQAVRVARNLHLHPEPLAELEARVVAMCERDGRATIAALRDELGSSRKIAQAVLEHLDRTKVTRRDGDAHVLRRRRV
ncbi:MAG: selenocysteine-specific elongation factor [Thermoleophilaceae bacterium]|nr:selenocysteine-specific elongation factor [Thermoleophilaceae bacterium]